MPGPEVRLCIAQGPKSGEKWSQASPPLGFAREKLRLSLLLGNQGAGRHGDVMTGGSWLQGSKEDGDKRELVAHAAPAQRLGGWGGAPLGHLQIHALRPLAS